MAGSVRAEITIIVAKKNTNLLIFRMLASSLYRECFLVMFGLPFKIWQVLLDAQGPKVPILLLSFRAIHYGWVPAHAHAPKPPPRDL
jgi:hypothetical protein